jgi:hypothetical protein
MLKRFGLKWVYKKGGYTGGGFAAAGNLLIALSRLGGLL